MHLDVFARALQADDGRDIRTERSRQSLDARIGREGVLDVLWVDVRAVGENDHVLLAATQPEEAVLVDLAEVAGVVPAIVIEDGACGLLVLPVPLEDVGSARKDFTVGADLHRDPGQRRADRAEPVELHAVEGEPGRALCRPVSLDHVDSEIAPRLAESGIERRPAGDDVAEAAAELAVHAEEDHPAHRHRQMPRDASQDLVDRGR